MTDSLRTHSVDVDFANENNETQAELEQSLRTEFPDLTFVVLTLDGPAGGNPLVRVFGTEDAIRNSLMPIYNDVDHVNHIMKRCERLVHD